VLCCGAAAATHPDPEKQTNRQHSLTRSISSGFSRIGVNLRSRQGEVQIRPGQGTHAEPTGEWWPGTVSARDHTGPKVSLRCTFEDKNYVDYKRPERIRDDELLTYSSPVNSARGAIRLLRSLDKSQIAYFPSCPCCAAAVCIVEVGLVNSVSSAVAFTLTLSMRILSTELFRSAAPFSPNTFVSKT
jgi:hypothetical protein